MIFCYEHDGAILEKEFPAGKAPRHIDHEGSRYQRAVWAEGAKEATPVVGVTKGFDRHFRSRACPRWDPDAPRHDKDGWALFSGQKEINEYTAKTRHREVGNEIHYGERIEDAPRSESERLRDKLGS